MLLELAMRSLLELAMRSLPSGHRTLLTAVHRSFQKSWIRASTGYLVAGDCGWGELKLVICCSIPCAGASMPEALKSRSKRHVSRHLDPRITWSDLKFIRVCVDLVAAVAQATLCRRSSDPQRTAHRSPSGPPPLGRCPPTWRSRSTAACSTR